jgi:hypothetical protein
LDFTSTFYVNEQTTKKIEYIIIFLNNRCGAAIPIEVNPPYSFPAFLPFLPRPFHYKMSNSGYTKPARTYAECIAHYKAAIFGALRLSVAFSAASQALPIHWTCNTPEEGCEIDAFHTNTQARAYRQEQNLFKLQNHYRRELAQILAYEESVRREAWQAKMDAWKSASTKHADTQHKLDEAAADAAVATLPESVTYEQRIRIRQVLLGKLRRLPYKVTHGGPPRRILRGLPAVACGYLVYDGPPAPKAYHVY